MTHELKTWTEYYDKIKNGTKKFEVRKNDRNFQVGDTLILKEWYPHLEGYSGSSLVKKVTYILHGGEFGIEEGYCVMSIE